MHLAGGGDMSPGSVVILVNQRTMSVSYCEHPTAPASRARLVIKSRDCASLRGDGGELAKRDSSREQTPYKRIVNKAYMRIRDPVLPSGRYPGGGGSIVWPGFSVGSSEPATNLRIHGRLMQP